MYRLSAPHHFCYTNTRVPRWHDIWTRMQVRGDVGVPPPPGAGGAEPPRQLRPCPRLLRSPAQIRVNSSRMIRVTQVGSEEELEQFSVWSVVFSFLKEKLNDTSIDVDLYSNKTCLKVELLETGTEYCVVLFRRTSAAGRGLRRGGLAPRRSGGGSEDAASSLWAEGQQGRPCLGRENGSAEGSVSSPRVRRGGARGWDAAPPCPVTAWGAGASHRGFPSARTRSLPRL